MKLVQQVDAGCRDEFNRTSLHIWAEVGGSDEIFNQLIHRGSVVLDAVDDDGMTPFLLSIMHHQEKSLITLIAACSKRNPINFSAQNRNGYSAFHLIALRNSDLKFARKILHLKIDLSLTDRNGRTAHQLALDAGHTALAKVLTIEDEWDEIKLD